MVIGYTNSTTGDSHRMRIHIRDIDTSGTYTGGTAPAETVVGNTFTAYVNNIKWVFSSHWTFSLLSVFKNLKPGFQEVFGWAAPTPIVGTFATSTYVNPADRAAQATWIMNDGFGGRLRLVFLGPESIDPAQVPAVIAGNPAGTAAQILVDYLSTATKTNIVTHNGHIAQAPLRATYTLNRRLRRHYGFA